MCLFITLKFILFECLYHLKRFHQCVRELKVLSCFLLYVLSSINDAVISFCLSSSIRVIFKPLNYLLNLLHDKFLFVKTHSCITGLAALRDTCLCCVQSTSFIFNLQMCFERHVHSLTFLVVIIERYFQGYWKNITDTVT